MDPGVSVSQCLDIASSNSLPPSRHEQSMLWTKSMWTVFRHQLKTFLFRTSLRYGDCLGRQVVRTINSQT